MAHSAMPNDEIKRLHALLNRSLIVLMAVRQNNAAWSHLYPTEQDDLMALGQDLQKEFPGRKF